MLEEAILGRFIVIGRNHQGRIRAAFCGMLGQLDRLARRIRTGPGNHRNASLGDFDTDLNHPMVFGMTQSRRFSGRPTRNQPIGSGNDLPFDKVGKGRFVEAVALEGRDEGSDGTKDLIGGKQSRGRRYFWHEGIRDYFCELGARLARWNGYGKQTPIILALLLLAGVTGVFFTGQYGSKTAQSAPQSDMWIRALEDLEARDWLALSQQQTTEPLKSYITWRRLRDEEAPINFERARQFLNSHNDWPNLYQAYVRMEQAMPAGLSAEAVIAHFTAHPARSIEGVSRHAEALLAMEREDAARDLVAAFWRGSTVYARDENTFLGQFSHLLGQADHEARLDWLLWRDQFSAAERLYPVISAGHRALARARILLARQRPGVDAAIANVPKALRSDPGLIYERMVWRRRAGMTDGAAALLEQAENDIDVSAAPDSWWQERQILVRRYIASKNYARAYALASTHGNDKQAGGLPFAEAEFLSGFLALRFLDNPEDAYAHFQDLYEGVSSPISRARGAYWAGRAAQTMGDSTAKAFWYGKAAAHPTTFYGQQAIRALGRSLSAQPRSEILLGDEVITPEARATFERDSRVQVARALIAAGAVDEAEPFLQKIGYEAEDIATLALAVKLAFAANQPGSAVRIARQGAARGLGMLAAGYPVITRGLPNQADRALVHALTLQESRFDTQAISPAGARGLMQLMPTTAREVARREGLGYSRQRLTDDARYNLYLGSTYVQSLIERFGGADALAIAGYNAGPGNVNRWLRAYGDPRTGTIAWLDWLELIPFSETRNYVQRVAEARAIYRYKFGEG